MAKKLIRIKQPKDRDYEKYSNLDVNLVLLNGSVYFGQVKKVKLNELIFSDKLNNKRTFAFSDVAELVIDEPHHF